MRSKAVQRRIFIFSRTFLTFQYQISLISIQKWTHAGYLIYYEIIIKSGNFIIEYFNKVNFL